MILLYCKGITCRDVENSEGKSEWTLPEIHLGHMLVFPDYFPYLIAGIVIRNGFHL